MSAFAALNVEPEVDVEEEVDDSKEIQVEEALKLYQAALKLHVQGPAFYEEAEEAYDALFASEIFKYPESQSEAKRLAQLNHLDDSDLDEADEADGPPPPAGIEAAPNTLPQLLYLSYKNHGQFLVDRVAHHITLEKESNPDFVFEHDKDAREAAREPLDFFVEALDRDETDSDLWRRTARICRLLGSRRLLRYCTEAALLAESLDGSVDADGSSIESVFAQAELGSVVEELEDDLSRLTLKSLMQKARRVSKSRRKIMDPFPKLPDPTVDPKPLAQGAPKAYLLNVQERSWNSIGKAILARRKQNVALGAKLPFANDCQLVVPAKQEMPTDGLALSSPQKLVAAESLVKNRPSIEDTVETITENVEEGDRKKQTKSTDIAVEDRSPEKDAAAETQPSIIGEDVIASPIEEKADNQATAKSRRESEAQSTKSRRESDVRSGLKRNSESAGLGESGETRGRSKRLRARQETTAVIEEDIDPEEQRKQFDKQLQPLLQADEWVFKTVDSLCAKVNIQNMGTFKSYQTAFSMKSKCEGTDSNRLLKNVLMDFKEILGLWDLNRSNLLNQGRGSGASVTLIGASDDSGLASFLEHSKPNAKLETQQTPLADQGISEFIDIINSQWSDTNQVALQWIEHLLQPRSTFNNEDQEEQMDKYTTFVWPISLKETLSQLIVEADEDLFPTLRSLVLEHDTQRIRDSVEYPPAIKQDTSLMEMVQALFELHLDIYGKITNASSKVDQPTRILQRDRTKRWAGLASQAVSKHVGIEDEVPRSRALAYRYLWSTVIYVSLVDPTSREHVLVCLRDLKRTLQDAGEPRYLLPNSSVMPEISVEAADREITRLTTMDFFLSIFDPNTEDPVATIESLEPILMEAAAQHDSGDNEDSKHQDADEEAERSSEKGSAPSRSASPTKPRSQKLSEFLGKASASLRLSLWHRLRAAYEEIEYPPMVLLCNIKSMEIILAELKGSRYFKEAKEDRSANLLVWIRNISDILNSCLDIMRREKSSLDCLDNEHLPTALSIVVDLSKILQTFASWEDSVRVGQVHAPTQASGGANPYKSAMNLLRELHCKCWVMLYYLLREISIQNSELFTDAKGEIAEYLAAVHNAFSWREYCRVGKKVFLKLMKTELISLDPPGDWSLDLAQVVYDLYGLKIYSKGTSILEHACNPDQIDRASALELIDPFMAQVKATNIRDVLRSEMRVAAEKMQAVIGTPRSGQTSNSSHQAFNRRLLLAYLKASINPLDLYRSLRGIGALEVMSVVTDYGAIARKKWYFLQGHLLLAKYQAQKRNAPGDDEDLDKAINYFKLDLDFDAENWETWYRLAQTYDAKVDEAITWDSKEINDPKSDVVVFQKSAIHCYTMAVAVGVRHADEGESTLAKLSELYADFGIRLYASSRAPLSMRVFALDEYERFYNSELRGTYKEEPFKPMKQSAAWRLAAILFRKALKIKPESWVNWFMLGKCLWKLFGLSDPAVSDTSQLLTAFTRAVDYVPMKRDSKHPDKDPVLEPHYKLASIAYKLLKLGRLTFDEAVEFLQHSPHARKVQRSDFEDARAYILGVLKALRAVDKSNWHHRMVARVAHIHYDDDPASAENAEIAKRELTQQIFTKTMTIQVWRPEYERPGRHFVYKTNYTRFFVQLLGQLKDRASVDLLAKRIRKKQNEFIAHTDLWTDLVTVYLKLLRDHGKVPENHADTVFKSNLSFENFVLNAGRLEAWAHSQLSLGNSTLDLLREIIELKKLNGVYIKPGIIDELVEDTYALIYEQNVPGLAAKADEAENRDRMRIDRMLMTDDPPQEPESSATGEPATASGRPKTIGRGEIRRRAEALVSKLIAPSQGRNRKREPQSPTAARGGLHPNRSRRGALGEDGDKEGSVAPSMQDDADDESELSEPPADEDDEDGDGNEKDKAKSGFAGLLRKEMADAEESMADGSEAEVEDEEMAPVEGGGIATVQGGKASPEKVVSEETDKGKVKEEDVAEKEMADAAAAGAK